MALTIKSLTIRFFVCHCQWQYLRPHRTGIRSIFQSIIGDGGGQKMQLPFHTKYAPDTTHMVQATRDSKQSPCTSVRFRHVPLF